MDTRRTSLTPNQDFKASSTPVVVIGGGIAGVSFVEHLAILRSQQPIILISCSRLVKAVTAFKQVAVVMETFMVEEREATVLERLYPNVTVVTDTVTRIDAANSSVYTKSGMCIAFSKLCVCTGGKPNSIDSNNPNVLCIRDTESVQTFCAKLANARRIVLLGNGGIATELVYEISECEVVWAIRDGSIGKTFFDPGIAEFLLPILEDGKLDQPNSKPIKRTIYTNTNDSSDININNCNDTTGTEHYGTALGPDWKSNLIIGGKSNRNIRIEYKCELTRILQPNELIKLPSANVAILGDWPIYVELSNGRVVGCDFVVSATGVSPNTDLFGNGVGATISPLDGGLLADTRMETSVPGVFAAGDVCTTDWGVTPLWFQMRLWTQARQMGVYAARCVDAALDDRSEDVTLDFCFEMYSHVTEFFGFKVVLLGLYNGQGLSADQSELLVRFTPRKEFIKLITVGGRIKGAILVGDTQLDETIENLMLNQTDVSCYGDSLLDPDIDIEDYFD